MRVQMRHPGWPAGQRLGFTVANETYRSDDGSLEVLPEHVDAAKVHGFQAVEPEKPARAAKRPTTGPLPPANNGE